MRRIFKEEKEYITFEDKAFAFLEKYLPEFGNTRNILIIILKFIIRVFSEFKEDECISRASSLAFTTLLALVPVTALSFSLFAAFSAVSSEGPSVDNFLYSFLIPKIGNEILSYVKDYSKNAAQLSFIGVIFLIVSAVSLLNTIQYCFNRIWGVVETRSFINKLLAFWGVVSLGPLLIALSIFLGANLQSILNQHSKNIPILRELFSQGGMSSVVIYILIPPVLNWSAFFLAYKFMPNTYVTFKAAFFGAAASSAMWEVAKQLFSYYVSAASTYGQIYGKLSILPLFLLWLFLAWAIVLLGSEISYTVQNPLDRRRDIAKSLEQNPNKEMLGIKCMIAIGENFSKGADSPTISELAEKLLVGEDIAMQICNKLETANLLVANKNETPKYYLTRDPRNISTEDIVLAMRGDVLLTPSNQEDEISKKLSEIFNSANKQISEILKAKSLKSLID